MKILITGALGHIGSALIRKLPYPMRMIDNLSSQRYCSLFDLPNNNYEFIDDDLLTCDLNKLFTDITAVVHLAAITDAASSVNHAEQIFNNNYLSTKRLADMCCDNNIPLLFPSSTSVYGSQYSIVDENCLEKDLKPQSPYAECKLREERYLQFLANNKDLQMVICRLGTIFGPSSGMRFHTAVNKFCWQAVLAQPLSVWKTAFHQKRPYLYVNDAVDAIEFILKNQLFNGEIYNIVTSNHTVRNVTDVIKQNIPDTKIKFVNNAIMNQLSYEVCDKKIRNRGFNTNGNLTTGIQETIKLLIKCKKSL